MSADNPPHLHQHCHLHSQTKPASSCHQHGSDADESDIDPATLQSIRPAINSPFLDSSVPVSHHIGVFETETREVYRMKSVVLQAIKEFLQSNSPHQASYSCADLGAGTGLLLAELNELIGSNGRLYACEIAEKFLPLLEAKKLAILGDDENQRQTGRIQIVQSSPTSLTSAIPSRSLDFIIGIDVYHHFEYLPELLNSIKSKLKSSTNPVDSADSAAAAAVSSVGYLVLLDYQKIPGISTEWAINHIRADKETAFKELEENGFKLIKEFTQEIPLKENWMAIFKVEQ